MHTWEWVVIAVVLLGAMVFTLAWWKIADYWADAEHKRFKDKGDQKPSERVVIKRMGGAGAERGGKDGDGHGE